MHSSSLIFRASGTCYFWLSLGPLVIERSPFSELNFKNLQQQTHPWLQSCFHIGVAESFIHSMNVCSMVADYWPVLWTVISHAGLILSGGLACDFSEDGRPHAHLTVSLSKSDFPLQEPLRSLSLPGSYSYQFYSLLCVFSLWGHWSLPHSLQSGCSIFKTMTTMTPQTHHPNINKREEKTFVIRPLFSASLPPWIHLADLVLLTYAYLLTPGTFVIWYSLPSSH